MADAEYVSLPISRPMSLPICPVDWLTSSQNAEEAAGTFEPNLNLDRLYRGGLATTQMKGWLPIRSVD